MPGKTRVYSRLGREALSLLAKQIQLARKSRGMSESDLAARAGIARSTVQKIERGDPNVEIGLVFEAAVLAGVCLFDAEPSGLAARIERLDDKLALLPRRIRWPEREVNDDF